MLGYHPNFQYIGDLMTVVAEVPTMPPHEAASRVRSLAERIRQSTSEIPRKEALGANHVQLLKLAQTLTCGLSDLLVKACPSVEGTDEFAALADAIDDLDNQVENHEIARAIGPRVAELRSVLAV